MLSEITTVILLAIRDRSRGKNNTRKSRPGIRLYPGRIPGLIPLFLFLF
ncbi:MAG: hypothetical protein OP8BY_0533 [Candidatus Saccharicenans subterraneus]|uniref:Uncharacterized protein n=1 Tax=Candidatus Saccharicenans subterraneus TaxID=2508984 RepID=A0A3E2BKH2_9BACT|nr:MAG: hypothetical protein OP8BY_0533 [Candidatus Saccharicenans subterraneum]